jgi:cytidylate kinase
VKVFLDAEPAVRSERRLKELREKGKSPSADEVLKELDERDQRDRSRSDSPLMQAPDALFVDTSGMSIDEVERTILKIVRDRTSNGKELSR